MKLKKLEKLFTKKGHFFQVFDSLRQQMYTNFSNSRSPHFVLRGLSPTKTYRFEAFAVNRKGSSQRTIFTNVNLSSVLNVPASQFHDGSSLIL